MPYDGRHVNGHYRYSDVIAHAKRFPDREHIFEFCRILVEEDEEVEIVPYESAFRPHSRIVIEHDVHMRRTTDVLRNLFFIDCRFISTKSGIATEPVEPPRGTVEIKDKKYPVETEIEHTRYLYSGAIRQALLAPHTKFAYRKCRIDVDEPIRRQINSKHYLNCSGGCLRALEYIDKELPDNLLFEECEFHKAKVLRKCDASYRAERAAAEKHPDKNYYYFDCNILASVEIPSGHSGSFENCDMCEVDRNSWEFGPKNMFFIDCTFQKVDKDYLHVEKIDKLSREMNVKFHKGPINIGKSNEATYGQGCATIQDAKLDYSKIFSERYANKRAGYSRTICRNCDIYDDTFIPQVQESDCEWAPMIIRVDEPGPEGLEFVNCRFLHKRPLPNIQFYNKDKNKKSKNPFWNPADKTERLVFHITSIQKRRGLPLNGDWDSMYHTKCRGYPVHVGVPEPPPPPKPVYTKQLTLDERLAECESDKAGLVAKGQQLVDERHAYFRTPEGIQERIDELQAKLEKATKDRRVGSPDSLGNWLKAPVGGMGRF